MSNGQSGRFDGRLCVVTGATSGIGRAVAACLARRGATVSAIARNQSRLDDLVSDLGTSGGRVVPYRADLESESELRVAASEIERDHGRVDVLVHCAAVLSLGPVESAPVAQLDRQYRVNVRAPYLLTQLLFHSLRSAGGQIVFVNSSTGLHAGANVAQYSATKHALRGLADALRSEVNPQGVRVLSVYPGQTATPMQQSIYEAEGRPYQPERLLQPDDVAEVILSALSLPRSGEVTDVSVRPMVKPRGGSAMAPAAPSSR
jgi:NAD(P)-dependent dehydrogenase (short-subunit alcohol dehydrogenase family)